MQELAPYLVNSYFIESDHPDIQEFAKKVSAQAKTPAEKVQVLYYAVRDGWRYYPYHLRLKKEALRASYILQKDYGYCVEKSVLFASCLRAIGIPARLGFANVRNHLATKKVEEYLRTDLMVFHAYTEVFLHNRWIKLTPVFNKTLCERLNVAPLDFNGQDEAIFQESDKSGQPFMSYEKEYGHFADLPLALFIQELRHYYPHIFEQRIQSKDIIVDF